MGTRPGGDAQQRRGGRLIHIHQIGNDGLCDTGLASRQPPQAPLAGERWLGHHDGEIPGSAKPKVVTDCCVTRTWYRTPVTLGELSNSMAVCAHQTQAWHVSLFRRLTHPRRGNESEAQIRPAEQDANTVSFCLNPFPRGSLSEKVQSRTRSGIVEIGEQKRRRAWVRWHDGDAPLRIALPGELILPLPATSACPDIICPIAALETFPTLVCRPRNCPIRASAASLNPQKAEIYICTMGAPSPTLPFFRLHIKPKIRSSSSRTPHRQHKQSII